MSIIDIILIICFIPAIINGVRKGFIAQIAAIISLVAGVWLSYKFSGQFSEWLSTIVHADENVIKVISFATIFILVAVALSLLARVLEGLLKVILLGWLNKFLGVIFAIIKYALVLCMIIYFFDIINKDGRLLSQKNLDESVMYGFLSETNQTVFPYLKDYLNSL